METNNSQPSTLNSQLNIAYFQQTPFWAQFKSQHGWKSLRLSIANFQNDCEVSVMVRSFAKGLFSLAYIPMWPVLSQISAEEFCDKISEIALAIKPQLPKKTIVIRFDPALDFSTPSERDDFVIAIKNFAKKNRFLVKKSKVDIQPPDTTCVDLTQSEDEILAKMKSKWRYNINLAKKKGVQIECVPRKVLNSSTNSDSKNDNLSRNSLNLATFVDRFYELYKVTAARDGIAIHSKQYYLDLLQKSADEIANKKDVVQISLYIARHEGDDLGAIITLFSKNEAVYLYGCSSNLKRNLMPNFLLQWTAMCDAKAFGSKYYDFYGMPPTDDANHPMHGLYQFKTGFGGKNIHRVGTLDFPLKKVYGLCAAAERARAWWHKKVLKKLRGR